MPREYFELKKDIYTLRLSGEQPLHACVPWAGKVGDQYWRTGCGLKFPRVDRNWVLRKVGEAIQFEEVCKTCMHQFILNSQGYKSPD